MDDSNFEKIKSIIQEVLSERKIDISRISYFSVVRVATIIKIHQPAYLARFTGSYPYVNLESIKWTHYNYHESSEYENVIGLRSEDTDFDITVKNDSGESNKRFRGRIHAYIKERKKRIYSFCVIEQSSVTDWHPLIVEDGCGISFTVEGGLTKGVR